MARAPATARGARLVLACGLLLGAAVLASLFARKPGWLGMNFEVYHVAARAALRGGDVYAAAPADHPAYRFVYPPGVLLAFLPAALVPWTAAFVPFTLANVACAAAVGHLCVREVERLGAPLPRLDRALVVAFAVASIHSMPSLFYGNVNLPLSLAVAAGVLALDRGRERVAGAAFALPAVVKVFPAVFGVWLLRRRARRAVAAAVGVGAAVALLGLLSLGVEAHLAYLREALLPRLATDAFRGGLDPAAPYLTVRRPLSHLFPGSPSLLTPLAALLLAPVVAYCYRGIETGVDRLVAVHATLLGTLLFFPSYPLYLVYAYVSLVPLLYLLEGPGRRLFVAGAFATNFVFTLPDVVAVLARVGASAGVETAVLGAARPLLTVGLLPLYGGLLTLAGCVRHRRHRRREAAGNAENRR